MKYIDTPKYEAERKALRFKPRQGTDDERKLKLKVIVPYYGREDQGDKIADRLIKEIKQIHPRAEIRRGKGLDGSD